jgi:hypothetical protein
MYIKNLKVRPRKSEYSRQFMGRGRNSERSFLDLNLNVCAPHLSAMLACWAATSDLSSSAACKDTATALFQCMRTAVCDFLGSLPTLVADNLYLMKPMGKKKARPTINYHLSRLGKIIQ